MARPRVSLLQVARRPRLMRNRLLSPPVPVRVVIVVLIRRASRRLRRPNSAVVVRSYRMGLARLDSLLTSATSRLTRPRSLRSVLRVVASRLPSRRA